MFMRVFTGRCSLAEKADTILSTCPLSTDKYRLADYRSSSNKYTITYLVTHRSFGGSAFVPKTNNVAIIKIFSKKLKNRFGCA